LKGHFQIRPPPIPVKRVCFGHFGVETIKAIQIGHMITIIFKNRGKGKETKGFGPEIIGSKIMYPGVDKKNMWYVASHRIRI
jgi:hypothetical protein